MFLDFEGFEFLGVLGGIFVFLERNFFGGWVCRNFGEICHFERSEKSTL